MSVPDADARTVAHLAVELYRAAYGTADQSERPSDFVHAAAVLLAQARAAVAAFTPHATVAVPVVAPIATPGAAPDAPVDAL